MKITENKEITASKDRYKITVVKDKTTYNVTYANSIHSKVLDYYNQLRANKDETVFDAMWTIVENEYNNEDSKATPSRKKEGISPEKCLDLLIKFFSEFNFEPNFRFVNTLCNTKDKFGYISRYFSLINSPYENDVIEKMKSAEFKQIREELDKITPTTTINKRFKLYYGSQGTGKTTVALTETDNRCMICHNAMLPSDLMEDFTFDDGKASFHPSALCKAMTEGQKIVLDEINLLPFESLRFLQSILDGKTEFLYKGNTINIADGFQIIGTMNLVVNGMTFGLPEPLVDRCLETKCFKLTPSQLLQAIK